MYKTIQLKVAFVAYMVDTVLVGFDRRAEVMTPFPIVCLYLNFIAELHTYSSHSHWKKSNHDHLLSACNMQGMILVFSDLTPGQLSEVGFFFSPFCSYGNWSSERLNDLWKVTQQGRCGTGIGIHVWLPRAMVRLWYAYSEGVERDKSFGWTHDSVFSKCALARAQTKQSKLMTTSLRFLISLSLIKEEFANER